MSKTSSIPLFAVHMPDNVDGPLLKVLHSGYIGQGPKVEEFEKRLQEYLNNPNVLTVNSGTSALHLALRLANVAGGEVITTAMTCSATNEPILANGAKIRWADINPQSGLIDADDIAAKIKKGKTKAILAVDWGGTPVDLDKLLKIGKLNNIPVIEDAAHAFGSTYKGRKVGQIADLTCFSFQAIKHITTVDGGLLAAGNKGHYKRGKLLRWYGIDREIETADSRIEIDIPEWGYKFHMNDVTAVIGLEQMKHIDKILNKHRKNAKFYSDHLNSEFFDHQTKQLDYDHDSSFWLYTMRLPNKKLREKYVAYMKENGVSVSQVHSRLDRHTAFKQFQSKLPGVDEFTDRMICIPVHWALSSEQRERIIDLSNKFAHTS